MLTSAHLPHTLEIHVWGVNVREQIISNRCPNNKLKFSVLQLSKDRIPLPVLQMLQYLSFARINCETLARQV